MTHYYFCVQDHESSANFYAQAIVCSTCGEVAPHDDECCRDGDAA